MGAAALAAFAVVVVAIGMVVVGADADPASSAKAVTLRSAEASPAAGSLDSASTVPVEVPALVGMSIAEAEMVLKAAGLTVVRISTPPGDSQVGTVLAQTPVAGERVSRDTVIELVYADSAAGIAATTLAAPTSGPGSGLVVCIDPGHQEQANGAPEPVGPGSTEVKTKVTGGASGVVTHQSEHALALAVSLKIKERLERYGVCVVMTRTAGAVDISNAQRAAVANEAGADLFVRVHADGNTNATVRGVSTLYPGSNDWVAPIQSKSLAAASSVHRQMLLSTGATDRGMVKRADLAGFNYATVPSILVEMGFLSNPVDDKQLAEESYRDKLADGIARGILEYLGATE